MNRRDFIAINAATSAGVVLPSFLSKPSFTMNKNYELKIMATNWGFSGTTDEFCAKAIELLKPT
jgi:hypothetical protein